MRNVLRWKTDNVSMKISVVKMKAQDDPYGRPPANKDPWAFELGYVRRKGRPTVMHIRNYLNKLKWHPEGPKAHEVKIFYADFEALDGLQEISFAMVEDVSFNSIELLGGTSIPFHRIRKVRVGEEVQWKRLPPVDEDPYVQDYRDKHWNKGSDS